jgi:hypothetical protein
MIVRLLALLLLAAPALADEPIDWTEASTCIGRVCSIRGTVVEQEDGGPYYRLYFDAERRDVYVTLMRGWLVTWGDYVGQRIVATGPVDRWRESSEMILRTPDAIALLDPPAVTATPATDPSPTPDDEVERLRDRVRSLEDKIERLERDGHQETP